MATFNVKERKSPKLRCTCGYIKFQQLGGVGSHIMAKTGSDLVVVHKERYLRQ